MKRFLVFAVSALLVGCLVPYRVIAQTAVPRIALIDLQKVVAESDKGKEVRKNLTDEFEKLKKNLQQRQDELQKLKDSLDKQASTMNPDARSEKEKQYQTKLKDYQRLEADYEGEMQQKQQEQFQRILKDLEEVVKGFGDTEKYSVIFEKSQAGVLYGSTSIDVSDKIVALYNESAKKKTAPRK
jgi:outer membrane protein